MYFFIYVNTTKCSCHRVIETAFLTIITIIAPFGHSCIISWCIAVMSLRLVSHHLCSHIKTAKKYQTNFMILRRTPRWADLTPVINILCVNINTTLEIIRILCRDGRIFSKQIKKTRNKQNKQTNKKWRHPKPSLSSDVHVNTMPMSGWTSEAIGRMLTGQYWCHVFYIDQILLAR